jgi:hypothetical protein
VSNPELIRSFLAYLRTESGGAKRGRWTTVGLFSPNRYFRAGRGIDWYQPIQDHQRCSRDS